MNYPTRDHLIRVLPIAAGTILVVWQRSILLESLSYVRTLVYEQPVLVLAVLLSYIVAGVLLSFRTVKVLPFFLSGLVFFAVFFNVFASYQEILKFGINQDVFTGLVNILVHSPIFPLLLVSAGVESSYVLGAAVILFVGVKGFVIVNKWINVPLAEKILLSWGFGMGITAFFMFILAALQLLTFRNVLLTDLALFCIIFLLPKKKFELPGIKISLTAAEKKWWTFVSIILVGGFIYAVLFPPLEWDSLAYQAYYSKLIYEHQGLPPIFGPSIGIEMSAAYPPAYQMLGCYIYVIIGEPVTNFMSVLSYLAGILSLIVVFLFAHHTVPSHRMYAVITAVAVPFFLGFSASPHYMTLLIFFNGIFLVYLFQYILKDNIHALYVAVLFLGFACLTSYLALASFLFLAVVYIKKKYPIIVWVVAAVAALPPLLRNFWFTQNPLFPLFGAGGQLQNALWESNTAHFDTQAIYAGLKITSPFSVLDFFMNRISSVRPLIPLIMIVGILFLLFVRPHQEEKEKKWLIIFFAASIVIFLVRPTFDRYVLVHIPVYASFAAWLLHTSEKHSFTVFKRALQLAVAVSLSIVIVGIVITGPLMVASHMKQFPDEPLDQWAYVYQFYPHDTPCWRFLNENTPPDAYVATYDIRYYYIDKKIFALDGLEAVSLYTMSFEEALTFLKEKNVVYWFSSRWTSPADATCPPAYYDNPLTNYLGSDMLPLVFVSGQSAVYHIGRKRIDYQHILETENVLYPVKGHEYEFSQGKMVYFDIPGDFHKKTIVFLFSQPVKASIHPGHAASSDLLGDAVHRIDTASYTFVAYSGKYTLYIESESAFTLSILIE